ncbi:MAG: elongation factor P [Planctomycetota bacterium]|jgi:elongation factor P
MGSYARDVKRGQVLNLDGNLHKVTNMFHGTPGNKRAFIQMDLKDLKSGNNIKRKFSVTDPVEIAFLDTRPMEYLYRDGENHVFMDLETYEQFPFSPEVVEENMRYIRENTTVKVVYYEGNPISLDLPAAVVLKVEFTEPGAKGDTVSNVFKPAQLETGLEIKVPLYIEIGESVKVDTRSGEFLERVKE